jgi:hypothetical protein
MFNPLPEGGTSNTQTLTITAPVVIPQLTISGTKNMTRSGGNITLTAIIQNNSTADATNVQIKSSLLGTANTITSPLPTIPLIRAGQTTEITLVFPASAGNAGTLAALKVTGVHSLASFTANRRITLP